MNLWNIVSTAKWKLISIKSKVLALDFIESGVLENYLNVLEIFVI